MNFSQIPIQIQQEFYEKIPQLLEETTKSLEIPLQKIEQQAYEAISILKILPYHTQENEKIIYQTWEKIQTMLEEVLRIKNNSTQIQDQIRTSLNPNYCLNIENQRTIYEAFRHDTNNPLMFIGASARGIKGRVLSIMPESTQKKSLEGVIQEIIGQTSLIQKSLDSNCLNAYLKNIQ